MNVISIAASVYLIFLFLSLLSFALFYFVGKFRVIASIENHNKISPKRVFLFLFYSCLTSLALTSYIYLEQSICHEGGFLGESCYSTVTHITLVGIFGEINTVIFILKITVFIFLLIAFTKIFIPLLSTQRHYFDFLSKSVRPSKDFIKLCNKINKELKGKINFNVARVSVSYAGVIGFFRPLVIVPEGLLNELSPNELEGFMYHEASHVLNGDNMMRLIILFCRSIFFFLPLNEFYKEWDRERDLECDRIASYYTERPLSVASALLKTMKLSINNKRQLTFGFSGFSDLKDSFFKLRMEKLIEYSRKNVFEKNSSDFSGNNFLRLFSLKSRSLTVIPIILIFSFSYIEIVFHCFMEVLINIHM